MTLFFIFVLRKAHNCVITMYNYMYGHCDFFSSILQPYGCTSIFVTSMRPTTVTLINTERCISESWVGKIYEVCKRRINSRIVYLYFRIFSSIICLFFDTILYGNWNLFPDEWISILFSYIGAISNDLVVVSQCINLSTHIIELSLQSFPICDTDVCMHVRV